MGQLNFSTGVVSYSINGKMDVEFNPTDVSFMERIYNTFSALDKKQDEWEKERGGITEPLKMFEYAHARDTEMREMLDSLFGKEICEAVFGDLNVYAYADGFPLWLNFLMILIDAMDDSVKHEQKLTSPRMKKYMDKYKIKK